MAIYDSRNVKCKTNLSTVVNCNVLKLSLITPSKMLRVFTISSLFLPDPVVCLAHGARKVLDKSSATNSPC
jgi:energy-converting hydrogenase Eha subunit A